MNSERQIQWTLFFRQEQKQRQNQEQEQRQGKSKRKGKNRNQGKAKARTTAKAKAVKNLRTHEQTAREWDPRTHEGLVMIDSGASVNLFPKCFGNSKLEQSDGVACLRGANGKPLQKYGKRQIWLKICGQTKRYDFHVMDVTKPILSVSCLCENGVETHLAKKSFLRFGDGQEPLIRKGGVYFVKAQTVNASVRVDGCTEKNREYNLMGDQKNREYELMDS